MENSNGEFREYNRQTVYICPDHRGGGSKNTACLISEEALTTGDEQERQNLNQQQSVYLETYFSLALSARAFLTVVQRSIESPWLAICRLTVGGVTCVWERAPLCAGWVGLCVCVCPCACMYRRERAHGVWWKPWGSALSTEPFLLLFKLDQRQ